MLPLSIEKDMVIEEQELSEDMNKSQLLDHSALLKKVFSKPKAS
jgi:hypothetical protein